MSSDEVNQAIDFDLKLNDYRKILIQVKNLQDLNDDFSTVDSEYDGSLGTHTHADDSVTTRPVDGDVVQSECKFCSFYNVIQVNYSKIEINNQFISTILKTATVGGSANAVTAARSFVHVRYKTAHYPKQLLDLTEYQPWRSVYALICYSQCKTQAELLNAIKKFSSYKQMYKKTLIESKLFIVLSKTGSDLLRNLPQQLARSRSATSSSTTSSTASQLLMASNKKSFDQISISTENTDNVSIDFNNNMNTISLPSASASSSDATHTGGEKFDIVDDSAFLNSRSNTLLPADTVSEKSNEVIEDSSFEMNAELNSELKNLENNIIYLEEANEIADSARIRSVMHEIVNQVYIKLNKLADLVNSSDDKQLNYYSEFLKLPSERSKLDDVDSTASAPSLLQLKLINKKKVSGRMNKYRADLCLLLNSVETSFLYYLKAYNTLKKEQDFMWSASALFGLCLTSCYYTQDFKQPLYSSLVGGSSASLPANLSQMKSISSSTSEIEVVDSSKTKKPNKSLEIFKNKFKRQFSTSSNKDIEEHLISNSELYNNFRDILATYNKYPDYSFLEFEFSLMMAKHFIEKELPKHEIYYFINNCIYINSMPIREETRMRRYLEIAKLYEECSMQRLNSFYRWISAGRIFRLMSSIQQQQPSNDFNIKNLKRVLNKCIGIIVSVCQNLCIDLPLKPSERLVLGYEKGFPALKKRILAEIIQLYHYNNHFKESIKFTRYLLHEMHSVLTLEETNYFSKFLCSTPSTKHNFVFNEAYYTQFFNLPSLTSLRLDIAKDDLHVITKMPRSLEVAKKDEKNKSIYIHRYENPLLSATIKRPVLHTFFVDTVYTVQLSLSNQLPVDIPIGDIHFLTDLDKISETNDIPGYEFTLKVVKFEAFQLAAKTEQRVLSVTVSASKTGKFKLIGYLINSFSGYSKILFADLLKRETENKGNFANSDSLSSAYNIEVLPKLPVIKFFSFKSSDTEFELTAQEQMTVSCFTGEQKTFESTFRHDEDETQFEVISSKIQISNSNENDKNSVDYFESKLNLKADNLFIPFIAEEPHLHSSMNCTFEIKYSNKCAREEYLCRTMRRNFTVKFYQIIVIKSLTVTDCSENEFELELCLKNLHDIQKVNCEYNDNGNRSTAAIAPLAECTFKAKLTKLNFELIQSNENLNTKHYSKLVNDLLNFKVSYSNNSNEFYSANFDFQKLDSFKSTLFKLPISMVLLEKRTVSTNENPVVNIHFGFKLKPNSPPPQTLKYEHFSYELCKKLNYCLLKNKRKKVFHELADDTLYLEHIKYLQRDSTTVSDDNLKIVFSLNFKNDYCFKWNYFFKTTDDDHVKLIYSYF